MKRNSFYLLLLASYLVLVACSMTKDIPEGDRLFTGLKKIAYEDYEENDNLTQTQEEVEAALATAPNGAIFGSSYHRMPFSFGVAVWNKYQGSESGFGQWMLKTFGKQPVLMSWVNPELRAQVAQSVLRNHGYFNGQVGFETVAQKNPKTAKIAYTVRPGYLYTLDSVGYFGFPVEADSLIHASLDEAYIHKGDPFVVSNLDAERQRVSTLLRNSGYYYYKPGYASYLADTTVVKGKAQLRLQLADSIPDEALHPWYIGHVNINMRKSFMEQYTDTMTRRSLTLRFSGKKPPVRARVLMADLMLRHRQPYSYDNHVQSLSKLNAMGLFSSTDFQFTPRDRDTLDLTVNCVFDRPWDFYVETNFNYRTIGRMGPELRMGVTRRNAFRGNEKIDVNVHGSYEWSSSVGGNTMNNYDYGADASIEFPRIIAPFFGGNQTPRRDAQGRPVRPRRFFSTPTTLAKVSTDIIRRPNYYKMHIVSGEWTYRWQTSAQSRHEFSPLTVKYQFMNSSTDAFDSIKTANPYLVASMEDYFTPMMRYTYIYTSPADKLHPIRWETTISESGNFVSLGYMLKGRSWSEKNKTLFKNPYSQFLKLETDFTKTWTLNSYAKLVAHVNAGIAYAYGNSNDLPLVEMFYAGGANSIRAFSLRGVGPGGYDPSLYFTTDSKYYDNSFEYLLRNGTAKFVTNLEYRQQLFGNLHGAVFLDAGNVWLTTESYDGMEFFENIYQNSHFRLKNFLNDLALGTGIGLRYDLGFLVLRLDWGLGLHVPYDTDRSGYFNAHTFTRHQTLHFAIGYPF